VDEIITFRSNDSIDHALKVIMDDKNNIVFGISMNRTEAICYAIELTAGNIMRRQQLEEKEASEKKD